MHVFHPCQSAAFASPLDGSSGFMHLPLGLLAAEGGNYIDA
jgi:hypothetical protein